VSLQQPKSQDLALSEVSKDSPDYSDGLTLAAAFRKHVLEDAEIAAIGRRLSEIRQRNSSVFLEGQFPGPYVDFHWPLQISAESIAYAFVSSPLVLLDQPLPNPSELETVASQLLADRIAAFIRRLTRGEFIAVGTFAATGVEGPVGPGQWRRADLAIDVKNSAICEMRNHRPVPVWTGVWLQLFDRGVPNDQPVLPRAVAEQPMKARKQIQTKTKSRSECIDWLTSIMSDPATSLMTNDQLWAAARAKWPNKLSKREFDKCRALALGSLSEEQRWLWARPGPKRKSSQF
jgi:hypothetical protein